MSDTGTGGTPPPVYPPTEPPMPAATAGHPTGPPVSPPEPPATRDVAAQEARTVAEDASAAGRDTAAVARQQAGQVAEEAKLQAREVYAQAKDELLIQTASQHARAASGLHSLADELTAMVIGSTQSGVATDFTQQASERVRTAATWLESREPAEVLDEVKRFARQRPGTFLLAAAAIGLIGGRLTRSLAEEARDDDPVHPAEPVAPVVPRGGTIAGDSLHDPLTDPLPGYPAPGGQLR